MTVLLPNMRGPRNAEQLMYIGESLADSQRWAPYCEGLSTPIDRATTAILLENQLNFMENELNEVSKILSIGNFDKFSFPIIRAVYPNLIANELVSVQPMMGPTSLVFYMDILYGTSKGSIAAGVAAFDARTGNTGNESYSSENVPAETATITTNDIIHTLSRTPVRPGTVTVSATSTSLGAITIADNGNGGFVQTAGSAATISTGTINYSTGAVTIIISADDFTAATITYGYDGEAADNVPQVDVNFTSAPVQAITRKLRTRWSIEAGQNANALHGVNLEAEMVGAVSELIKHEIDREIINNLLAFAQAGTVTWDKTVPSGVSYTEHKLSIVDAFVAGNNKVYSATKRVQPNWIVAGIDVCNVVETLPMFQAAPGALETQGNTGVVKIGTLQNRWTVFKDPFMISTRWIQGFKGSRWLDTGYVYAPYIPIFMTPTMIFDDFMTRKGIGTRYGQKSVNSKYYVTGTLLNP